MIIECGKQSLDLTSARIMGVLNVTPDSFSDGGQFNRPDLAIAQARSMIEEGATLIDVGGESTRPGAAKVAVDEELNRVIPVIEAIREAFSDVVISVDTSTPEVMTESARAGASLLNDVRSFQREGALAAAVKTGLPVCLMHMQGEPDTMQQNPCYDNVVEDIYFYLARQIQRVSEAGIPVEKVIVDPGFGFGKTLDHNLKLLKKLERFKTLGVPLLAGMSRKSMIGQILNDRPVDGRLYGSVAAAVVAAEKGAKIIRVHDVKATVDALKVVEAVKRA